jgi:DnaJ like chaperone protein
MNPLGKITLGLIGLKLNGPIGFLWGMLLGHLLIDNKILGDSIKNKLDFLAEQFRLNAPSIIIKYYDKLNTKYFGKIFGGLMGLILLGFIGFIIGFLFGHFLFDIRENQYSKKFTEQLDEFWYRNWGKVLGGLIGFLFSPVLGVFWGIIAGFFADMQRCENVFDTSKVNDIIASKKDWAKTNFIKIASKSREARNVIFIQSMAGLAAKVAAADGYVTEDENKYFKEIFSIDETDCKKFYETFKEAKNSKSGYQRYARQIKILFPNNVELYDQVIEGLFKIAASDKRISRKELDILQKISLTLGYPNSKFESFKRGFDTIEDEIIENSQLIEEFNTLGLKEDADIEEIKKKWKNLMSENHPDKLTAQGASQEEIENATNKVAQINAAYEKIIKVKEYTK